MQVHIATVSDVPTIAQIHVETWRAAYRGLIPDAVLATLNVESRASFWQDKIAQDEDSVFVVKDGGSIAGFCDLIPTRDRDADPRAVAEIASIYIHPEHWRKGAGRALCNHALRKARKRRYTTLTLWVLATNDAAKRFYEAMGFTLDGAKKTDRTRDGTELHEVRFRIEL